MKEMAYCFIIVWNKEEQSVLKPIKNVTLHQTAERRIKCVVYFNSLNGLFSVGKTAYKFALLDNSVKVIISSSTKL